MALTKVRKRMSLRTVNNFTSNQTLTDSHDLVTGDSTGGAFTFTLPTASDLPGKEFTIQKISNDFSIITIGAVTTLNTLGEKVSIYSNGTSWIIKDRYIPSVWASDSYAALTVAAGFGTVTSRVSRWRREGDCIRFQGSFVLGTAAASSAFLDAPTGIVIDTAKTGTAAQGTTLGLGWRKRTGSTSGTYSSDDARTIFFDGSDTDTFFLSNSSASSVLEKKNVDAFFGNSDPFSWDILVPVVGWNG